jgi:hypothetical protein
MQKAGYALKTLSRLAIFGTVKRGWRSKVCLGARKILRRTHSSASGALKSVGKLTQSGGIRAGLSTSARFAFASFAVVVAR